MGQRDINGHVDNRRCRCALFSRKNEIRRDGKLLTAIKREGGEGGERERERERDIKRKKMKDSCYDFFLMMI